MKKSEQPRELRTRRVPVSYERPTIQRLGTIRDAAATMFSTED